jgi:hypothetical protein
VGVRVKNVFVLVVTIVLIIVSLVVVSRVVKSITNVKGSTEEVSNSVSKRIVVRDIKLCK